MGWGVGSLVHIGEDSLTERIGSCLKYAEHWSFQHGVNACLHPVLLLGVFVARRR